MSVSLRFPTYLSDIIVSKGVGHIQPNWNFSLSNGSLSINLTWNNVPTENLILSPPPLATTTHNQGYSRNTYSRPYNVREYRSFCPPRFQRDFMNRKRGETTYTSVPEPDFSKPRIHS